jgi:FXSXX-COOH protein
VENVIPEEEPALVDLTHISLRRLSMLGDSVLERSLQRLLAEADNPSESIAGFQSSVAAPED